MIHALNMEHLTTFYIASAILIVLAVLTATGKIDRLYNTKYALNFKNGRFALKQIRYNSKRMRPLSAIALAVMGLMMLTVPLFGLAEIVVASAILAVALIYGIIAMCWAVEN